MLSSSLGSNNKIANNKIVSYIVKHSFLNFIYLFIYFLILFIFKLYIIVLVLPNIKMNPPQVLVNGLARTK